jgi:hypothetical protein
MTSQELLANAKRQLAELERLSGEIRSVFKATTDVSQDEADQFQSIAGEIAAIADDLSCHLEPFERVGEGDEDDEQDTDEDFDHP